MECLKQDNFVSALKLLKSITDNTNNKKVLAIKAGVHCVISTGELANLLAYDIEEIKKGEKEFCSVEYRKFVAELLCRELATE